MLMLLKSNEGLDSQSLIAVKISLAVIGEK